MICWLYQYQGIAILFGIIHGCTIYSSHVEFFYYAFPTSSDAISFSYVSFLRYFQFFNFTLCYWFCLFPRLFHSLFFQTAVILGTGTQTEFNKIDSWTKQNHKHDYNSLQCGHHWVREIFSQLLNFLWCHTGPPPPRISPPSFGLHLIIFHVQYKVTFTDQLISNCGCRQ